MNPSEMTPQPPSSEQIPPRLLYPPPQEAFLVLLVSLVAALVGGAALVTLHKTGVFLTELLFLIPPWIYLRRKGYGLRRCLRWNNVPIALLLAAILIGLSLTVLLDEVDRIVNHFYPMPEELQKVLLDFLELKTLTDYLIIGSGVILAAAICEESLFRGFIQVSLEAYGPVNRAVLFSGLLFSLAHFNPWWMIQILILGVFLGFLSWRSNSSIPGMFIHAINNGLALFTGGSMEGDKWAWYNMGHHVSPVILIAAAALLFVGLKFFARLTEGSFRPDLTPTPEGDEVS